MSRVPRGTADHRALDRFQPSDLPPPPQRGRILRLVARLVLWTLIALGALRGLGPLPDRPGDDRAATTTAPARPDSGHDGAVDLGLVSDQAATATATAFLREYLTIDRDHDAWVGRLKRYLTRGLDLGTSVSVSAGTSQYVDYVQPVGTRSVRGAVEVTVLAHLLESRAGAYREGGMLAFVVPLTRGNRGLAVSGLPRPVPLPIVSGLSVRRDVLPPQTARDVAAVARRAVVALLSRNRADLLALGGGARPEARPLPDGWRASEVTTVQAAGPPEEPTAQVLVRVAPPTTATRYVIPVVVSLRSGPDGIFVRLVDAGGRP
jgi:hypothetical protein